MRRLLTTLAAVGLLAALAVALLGSGASASHVEPYVEPGNPHCEALGYTTGLNDVPPVSGTYAIAGSHTVTITVNGTDFDWTSTIGIDAVIVKGGPNVNVYVYDPPTESLGDTGLHAPINPENDTPYGLSHIDFCYDWEVEVTKTATTTFTREWLWRIRKSVTPDTWNLFTGDTGTSQYTVEVFKTGYEDSDWKVSGTISIHNPSPLPATIVSIDDTISGFGSVEVACRVTLPYQLDPGQTLNCTYMTDLPNGVTRRNTATVTTRGDVGGDSHTVGVEFGRPSEVVNGTIHVNDTYAGPLGAFSDSGSARYTRTFACDRAEGTHDNTATIRETQQSASASVTVNCYALGVRKSADTSLTRTWNWRFAKSADQTELTLSEGQLFTVNYEIAVGAASVDSEHAVTGVIAVHNPAPVVAGLTGVFDGVSPDIRGEVSCPVEFPYRLGPGETLLCRYRVELPDDATRTNYGIARLLNHDYNPRGVGTPSGTTDFIGMATVDFSDPTVKEVDECIDVMDTAFPGRSITICADQTPYTFRYSLDFGAHPDADVILECGDNTYRNVAWFVTNDSQTGRRSPWTVNANVACEFGCTLTQGYWKTHSEYGPAPYDDTWAALSNGAATPFFLSGQTYYDVLWTEPKGGNAYYTLAHQYIAAELNMLNGASVPTEVQDALGAAMELFETYTPDEIGALRGNNPTRSQFITLAGILGDYNEGLTGPGHCDE